jgi:SapC
MVNPYQQLNNEIKNNPSDGNAPLFYGRPRPLDKVKDATIKISRPSHYRFAAKANAIPLVAPEFPEAAAHYPIVFAKGPSPIPAAVTGLEEQQNLFVGENGQWQNGAYLPAYIRRYPFILMDDSENKQFILCLDETSEMLSTTGEYAFFEKGEPTPFIQEAMNFCVSLRQQGEATDAFMTALQEHDLLMENNAEVKFANGETLALGGFLIINPEKFDQLPDNVILEWRRQGWLGLVYAHLLSTHRWQALVEMAALRRGIGNKG